MPARERAHRPAARAPQRAERREGRAAEQRRETQSRREMQSQRRATEQAERQRAAEQRKQAAEQRAAATREKSAEQRRDGEKNRSTERQRAIEQEKSAAKQARSAEGRDGRDGGRIEKHKQAREQRAKLSAEERTRLRKAFRFDRDRTAKVRFSARVGHRIPRAVRLFTVPAAVYAILPYYRDYRYVVVDDTICIVDPDTYEIVDVLDEGPFAPGGSRPEVAELTLTGSERAIVLDHIPRDFPVAGLRLRLALGAEIPSNVELHEFAAIVLDRVPKLSRFRYFVTDDQAVVVDPRDRSIALVLDR